MNIEQGKYIHVVNVDGPNFKPNTFRFNANGASADDFIIIFNVKGNSIRFDSCEFGSLNGYAHRVIWNMPNVTSLYVGNVRVYGTILAPKAYAHSTNNNLQGQIIVKDFNGSLQVDWVKFKACLPIVNGTQKTESEGEQTQPETDTEQDNDQNTEQDNDQDDEPDTEPEELQPDDEENVPEVQVGDNENVEEDTDSENENNEVENDTDSEDENNASYCDDDFPFGIVSNFGAFSFNNFIASASDVQGRIAAKNLVDVSSYSINEFFYGGGRFRCDQEPLKSDFPFAVVAGKVKISDAGLYNGGIAYIDNVDGVSNDIQSSIINNGCQIAKIQNLIDFDKVEEKMNKISEELAELADTDSVSLFVYK